MAHIDLDSLTVSGTGWAVDDPIRKVWLQAVNDNSDDHETRIVDAEESVSDHETRLDLLESTGPSADRVFAETVTLTDAQIKALPSTPITVISAPDLNYRITVHRVVFYTNFANGAYSNVDTDSAWIVLQTPSAAWLSMPIRNDSTVALSKLTTVLSSTTPLTVDAGHYHTTDGGGSVEVATTTAEVDNKAVQIAGDNNGAGAWTGGHTSNTLTVRVFYSIDAVPAYYAPFTDPTPMMRQMGFDQPDSPVQPMDQDGTMPLPLA